MSEKMKRLLSWCTAVVWLCAAMPALAADKPVMTWMLMDWQPVSILVDGKPTDGIADRLVKELIREWPEVEHRFLVVVHARGFSNLAEGYPACIPTIRVSPEREKIAYFSLSHLAPPVQVIVRSDKANKLPKNDKGEVLPAALFDRPDLVGILEPYRSFSPWLDSLLNRRSPQSGIRKVQPAESGANILSMLQLGRGDYTLEYDLTLTYQQERTPDMDRGQGLRSFPLAGATLSPVGTACPRTAWGRAMIIKIDALMSKIAQRGAEYRSAEDHWMTPDNLRLYKKARDAFFLQRAAPSDPSQFGPP